MQPFNLTLLAGIPVSVNVEGDYCHVLTAPLGAGLWLRFDEGKSANYYEGVGLRTLYDRVEMMSLADQDVVVLLGFGSVFDARATANLNVNSTIEPSNILLDHPQVTVPAGASIVLVAAASSRKELRIALKSTEPGGLYIGSASVATGTGGWIEPGQFDYLSIEAALWAFNPGASNVVVTLLTLGRL
jgi:hypothetical protein